MASDNYLTSNLGTGVCPWMRHGWAIERHLSELDNQLQLRNVFERRADHVRRAAGWPPTWTGCGSGRVELRFRRIQMRQVRSLRPPTGRKPDPSFGRDITQTRCFPQVGIWRQYEA